MAERLLRDPPTCPEALNFGPEGTGWPVEKVVACLHEALGGGRLRIAPDPGLREAPALLIDASLARSTLGWRPLLDTAEALEWTAAWHRADRDGRDLRHMGIQQLDAYQQRLDEGSGQVG